MSTVVGIGDFAQIASKKGLIELRADDFVLERAYAVGIAIVHRSSSPPPTRARLGSGGSTTSPSGNSNSGIQTEVREAHQVLGEDEHVVDCYADDIAQGAQVLQCFLVKKISLVPLAAAAATT